MELLLAVMSVIRCSKYLKEQLNSFSIDDRAMHSFFRGQLTFAEQRQGIFFHFIKVDVTDSKCFFLSNNYAAHVHGLKFVEMEFDEKKS